MVAKNRRWGSTLKRARQDSNTGDPRKPRPRGRPATWWRRPNTLIIWRVPCDVNGTLEAGCASAFRITLSVKSHRLVLAAR